GQGQEPRASRNVAGHGHVLLTTTVCRELPNSLQQLVEQAEAARMPIRVIKHEVVPQTGSFEVRVSDGRPSVFFYWDDMPGRRLSSEQMDSNRAPKSLARSERDKIK